MLSRSIYRVDAPLEGTWDTIVDAIQQGASTGGQFLAEKIQHEAGVGAKKELTPYLIGVTTLSVASLVTAVWALLRKP